MYGCVGSFAKFTISFQLPGGELKFPVFGVRSLQSYDDSVEPSLGAFFPQRNAWQFDMDLTESRGCVDSCYQCYLSDLFYVLGVLPMETS